MLLEAQNRRKMTHFTAACGRAYSLWLGLKPNDILKLDSQKKYYDVFPNMVTALRYNICSPIKLFNLNTHVSSINAMAVAYMVDLNTSEAMMAT